MSECLMESMHGCCCKCRFHVEDRRHCGVDRKPGESCVCKQRKGLVCAIALLMPSYSGGELFVHSGWDEHGMCEEFDGGEG